MNKTYISISISLAGLIIVLGSLWYWFLQSQLKDTDILETIVFTIGFIQGEYLNEAENISQAIQETIKVDCDTAWLESNPEPNYEKSWYCGTKSLRLEKIEPYKNRLFALGKGELEDNQAFWWLAVKNEGFWNEIILEEDGILPQCEEIENIPTIIFDGRFNKCVWQEQIITCERETVGECIPEEI